MQTQPKGSLTLVVGIGLCLLVMLVSACTTQSPTPSPTPPATREPMIQPLTADDDFCPPPPGWYEYRVRAGDTIRSLAERTNSTIQELSAANCLNNPRALTGGMLFWVPQRILR